MIIYREKLHIIIIILIVICMNIVMAGNIFNLDYNGYKYFYNNAIDYGEVLYQNLTQIFYSLGFSYQEFKSISSVLFLLWLAYLLYEMAPKNVRLLTMCLYVVFPFFYDVIVVRNFMGSVLLLQGIYYLVSNHKHRVLLFLLFVLLACGFHSIFVLYIPFALIPSIIGNRKIQICLHFFIIVMAILAATDSALPIVIYILSYVDFIKIARFMLYINNRADWGILLFLFFTLIPVLFMSPYYRFSRKNNYICVSCTQCSSNQNHIVINRFISYIYYANMILLLYLPLIVLQSNFGRIFANMCIPNSIVLLTAAADRRYKYRFLTGLGIVLMYLLRAYSGIYVYKDVLSNNYFLN